MKTTTNISFAALALAWLALMPMAQAVGPDTEGNIPGANNGEGIGVLVSRTGGTWNTGTGFEALNNLTSGNQNTAAGVRALFSDINGGFNTATGVYSLYSNTAGFYNSATGAYTLANNNTGINNTANGYSALYFNTDGDANTASGVAALYKNTTGNANTATGRSALNSNTTGNGNVAFGSQALFSNTTGLFNNAFGVQALYNNIGGGNTAIGDTALFSNTTGSSNIALGVSAGSALTTGDRNIDIGSLGVAAESNTIRIGSESQTRTFITGIRGVTTGVADAVNVVIDSNGQLGTMNSSRRFKNEIKPMEKASEAILGLKPVTFHYKTDTRGTPQFGLIAEEVAKVNPDLVVRDAEGEIYSVRYEAVNAMLLNEFLKEHRKVQEQEATLIELKSTVARQQKESQSIAAQQHKEIRALAATVREQASQIQKVSAQLEASKPAPQVVNNP